MSSYPKYLGRSGLMNNEAPDITELYGGVKEKHAAWCSSFSCQSSKSDSKKGTLVYVGRNPITTCPKCGSKQFMYFDTVPETRVDV